MNKMNSFRNNYNSRYKVSVLPGLEGRLVEINEFVKLKYNFNQKEEEEFFSGKVFILSQFPLLEDTWEFTKVIKNILDNYVTSLEGNGWYINEIHVDDILSLNSDTELLDKTERNNKIELMNLFMENDNIDIMYKYTISIRFKHANIFVLQKENKLLQQEIKELRTKLKEQKEDKDLDLDEENNLDEE